MAFRIKIEPEARVDIQSAIDWYNEQKKGLGKRFFKETQTALKVLSQNPFYQKRYENVYCFPLKKFPYLIHFTINEENRVVIIRAIFHTSLNPKGWKNRP